MDIELLKTFLEVKDCRHFGRAADKMYLTQAAVSSRIRQLEQYFGVSLFVRNRNNIQLTLAGEKLVAHAESMLLTLQMAKQDIKLATEQISQLSLAGTANTWDAYIHDAVSKIYAAKPDISLIAEILPREQMTRLLLDKSLDVAILFDPPKVDELQIEHLHTLVLKAVTTYSEKVRVPENVKRYIHVDWGISFSTWHAKNLKHISTPSVRTSTARIALDLILQCGGTAYVPEVLAQPFVESGQLFDTELPSFEREVYCTFHRENVNEERILEIKRMLKQEEPEAPLIINSSA